MKNRYVLVLIFLLVFLSSCSSEESDVQRQENEEIVNRQYEKILDNITSGGPPQDGIPPIESPKYITVLEADDVLEDYDQVFIFEMENDIFLYPQRILVWHEIVNETFNGKNISITYCPLTGSTIAYLGRIGQYENTTFGTSGKLVNSNLIMYERETGSFIPQILGEAIEGSLGGKELKTKPIYWLDWKKAKTEFSEAKVLSDDTGFIRDYDDDPYGSYNPENVRSYYYDDGVLFNLMNEDDTLFRDKKNVIGIKVEGAIGALLPSIVKKNLLLNFKIGETPLIAFYDEKISNVRVFKSTVNGRVLEFERADDQLVDQSGVKWSVKGFSENGNKLDDVIHFEVMWFAWYAFYPETQVIQ